MRTYCFPHRALASTFTMPAAPQTALALSAISIVVCSAVAQDVPGNDDLRSGGSSSSRGTAGRLAAGAIAGIVIGAPYRNAVFCHEYKNFLARMCRLTRTLPPLLPLSHEAQAPARRDGWYDISRGWRSRRRQVRQVRGIRSYRQHQLYHYRRRGWVQQCWAARGRR